MWKNNMQFDVIFSAENFFFLSFLKERRNIYSGTKELRVWISLYRSKNSAIFILLFEKFMNFDILDNSQNAHRFFSLPNLKNTCILKRHYLICPFILGFLSHVHSKWHFLNFFSSFYMQLSKHFLCAFTHDLLADGL